MTRESYEATNYRHSQNAEPHTQALQQDLHSTGRSETRNAWQRMSQSTSQANSGELDLDFDKLPNYVKRNIRRMAREEEEQSKRSNQTPDSRTSRSDTESGAGKETKYREPVLKNGRYKEYHFSKSEWPAAQSAMSKAFLSDDPQAVEWARDMADPKTRGRALSASDPNRINGLQAAARSTDPEVRDWALGHMDRRSRAEFLAKLEQEEAGKHKEPSREQTHPVRKSQEQHRQPRMVEPAPVGGIDRPSGAKLVHELNDLADYEEKANLPVRQPRIMTDEKGYVIALPEVETNYRRLSKMVPNSSLYTDGGLRCADKAYTAGITVWPFNRIGVLFTEPNQKCELAQTVEQACLLPEVLAMESAHARTPEEAKKISESVITATKFCTETIDATAREKHRLDEEKRVAALEENDSEDD